MWVGQAATPKGFHGFQVQGLGLGFQGLGFQALGFQGLGLPSPTSDMEAQKGFGIHGVGFGIPGEGGRAI